MQIVTIEYTEATNTVDKNPQKNPDPHHQPTSYQLTLFRRVCLFAYLKIAKATVAVATLNNIMCVCEITYLSQTHARTPTPTLFTTKDNFSVFACPLFKFKYLFVEFFSVSF